MFFLQTHDPEKHIYEKTVLVREFTKLNIKCIWVCTDESESGCMFHGVSSGTQLLSTT